MALGIRSNGAAFEIIQKRVGKGGINRPQEVRRINQLLRMAGYLKTNPMSDATWSNESTTALMDFYKKNPENTPFATEYIDPHDYQSSTMALAKAAGVLVPFPNKLRSVTAIIKFFETCTDNKYPYGWMDYGQGSKFIMGFYGQPHYGICLTQQYDFSPIDRISFNCTSFANVLMSIWRQGNTASSPYFHGQSAGGFNPLGLRYGMNPVNAEGIENGYCDSIDAIKAVVKDNQLYNFCSCLQNGYIKHDMVLVNGYVYECNINTGRPIFRTPLAQKVKEMKKANRKVQLVGPMAV